MENKLNYLNYLGIAEISELIRSSKLSPVDVVKHCLTNIEQQNKKVNAFITVLDRQALIEAKAAEEEIKKGDWKGYLHGIPVAVKDFYDTAGIRTTAGSEQFKDRIPEKDAVVVSSLKDNGAILIGKTNMHELGMGTTSLISYFGSVHNPWDTHYVAGGSSGGSAAAIAAGMCYATVDTDAIGSCRLPASCCGITGFKVSNGLISMKGILEGEQADDAILQLSATGVCTRSANDTAIILDALNDNRGYSYYKDLSFDKHIKIGVVKNFKGSKEVKDAFYESVSVLESLGYETLTVEIPFEKATFDLRHIAADRQQINDGLFKKIDVVILPTITKSTLTIKDSEQKGPQAIEADNTLFCNYFGLPAISIPCGFDNNNMPLGLQIAGRNRGEVDIFSVAQKFQKVSGWHLKRPHAVL